MGSPSLKTPCLSENWDGRANDRTESWRLARCLFAGNAAGAAVGVRAARLPSRLPSLWSDEGISLLRASLPLTEMLRTMPVEHAPGYFVLLHFWLAWAGASDFSLRFLSLWPSVLAVAVVYRLRPDLGFRRAGVVAALLLATNAFQIWYAQEARMYSWLLAASLAATWLLARLLPPRGAGRMRRTWGLAVGTPSAWRRRFTCSTTASWCRLPPSIRPDLAVVHARCARFLALGCRGGAVCLLYLPWLPRLLGIFGFSGWRPPLDPWQLPWRYLTAYTAGMPCRPRGEGGCRGSISCWRRLR